MSTRIGSSSLSNVSRVSLLYVGVATVLAIGAAVVAYFLLRDEKKDITGGNSSSESMVASDLSGVHQKSLQVPLVNNSAVNIVTSSKLKDKAMEASSKMNTLLRTTKGDTEIRPVYVDNEKVDENFVKYAMFSNQKVMPRDEHPVYDHELQLDTNMKKQRPMFGAMTYPVNGIGSEEMMK